MTLKNSTAKVKIGESIRDSFDIVFRVRWVKEFVYLGPSLKNSNNMIEEIKSKIMY